MSGTQPAWSRLLYRYSIVTVALPVAVEGVPVATTPTAAVLVRYTPAVVAQVPTSLAATSRVPTARSAVTRARPLVASALPSPTK